MVQSRRTSMLVVALAAAWAGCYPPPEHDLDALGVPRFVDTSYIELADVSRISLFRSHDGHDYSDGRESCRSMKHYFKVPTAATVLYAPVTGIVRKVFDEWPGSQIHVGSIAQPAFTFVIFHASPAAGLSAGAHVTAGTIIGTHVGTQSYSDIAVEVSTPSGRRLVSYFETLTEAGFAPFRARGLSGPDALIITRAQRDAAPLTCAGETFTNAGGDPYPQDVAF